MLSSAIPGKILLPFATSGSKRAIPVASQIGITAGAASYTDGFPPLTFLAPASGGVPPSGQDFNGVLNAITAVQQWQSAGGLFAYDSAFSTAVSGYPKNAVLQKLDGTGTWRSLVDSNTANPDTGGANWEDSNLRVGAPVGSMRNAAMGVTAASASATFVADEIVVASALGGSAYRLPSFNKTINLAIVGAGGMDTGAAPASGYVALYAIYNPATGVSALLAANATAAAAPNIYGGANMPAGYTASALVSVWPTDASSRFIVAYQSDRTVTRQLVNVLNSSVQQASYAALSISGAVPLNARTCDGVVSTNSGTALNPQVTIAADANGLCVKSIWWTAPASSVGLTAPYSNLLLKTPQVLYYQLPIANTSGTVGITSYTF